MAGRSVVFFENVYYTDKLIAVHADIDDEAQTVHGVKSADDVTLLPFTVTALPVR